jgi:hypothetical protein
MQRLFFIAIARGWPSRSPDVLTQANRRAWAFKLAPGLCLSCIAAPRASATIRPEEGVRACSLSGLSLVFHEPPRRCRRRLRQPSPRMGRAGPQASRRRGGAAPIHQPVARLPESPGS